VAAQGSGARAHDVILSVMPRLVAPRSSLFQLHPEPRAQVLVETDPRFTNQRAFIGSDYFLQQLKLDPQRQMKRYGDAFFEQQLLNDQGAGLGRAALPVRL
jgi:filamentous hemagglutinin